MSKYLVNGLIGFSLLKEMEEIEAKSPKMAVESFIKKELNGVQIIDVFAERKNNEKQYNLSFCICEGYKNVNGIFCKVGRYRYYRAFVEKLSTS